MRMNRLVFEYGKLFSKVIANFEGSEREAIAERFYEHYKQSSNKIIDEFSK